MNFGRLLFELMKLTTYKTPVILIVLTLGVSTNVLSQRIIKGKVVDEDNRPVMGVSLFLGNSNTGWLTDSEGAYSIQVKDSINEIILVIDDASLINGAPPQSLCLYEQIREKFTIGDKDSINFRLIRTQNTFNKIPKSNKIKDLCDDKYKYEFKHNLFGKLQHVYLKNLENENEIEYVWDIEYYKDYIQIHNYIWQQSKGNDQSKISYNRTIIFRYDRNGAIREKSSHVDDGNHSYSSYEKYNYQDNKVSSIFCYDGINHSYYTNIDRYYSKEDILFEVIQNEILRRKLYKRIKNKFFNSDYKIVEIAKS
jgi:hypothetical protein